MRSFKARIQEKFDARPQYDYKNTYHPRVAKEVVEFSCLKRGERVLDLACGTGLATFEAARHVVTGTVTGLDLTVTMLHQAEEKMIAGNVDNVVFQLGDFDEVEFLPCSFDAILMASGSTYVTDFKAFAARTYQWLKPGGRLVYNTPRVPFSPLTEMIRGLVARYGVDIQDPAQAMGQPQWRSVLEAAGFNSIEAIQETEILTGEPIKRKDYPDFSWWLCNEIFGPQFNLKSALGTQRLGEIKAVFLKEAERIGSKLKGSEGKVVDEHDMLFVKAVKTNVRVL